MSDTYNLCASIEERLQSLDQKTERTLMISNMEMELNSIH